MAHDTPPENNDDDELELEDVDPEVLKHRRTRAEQITHAATIRAEAEQAYEEPETADPIDFSQFKDFRFTTNHLLIATAVLSMVMTLFLRLGGCNGLFVTGLICLAVGWWFVLRKERREALLREEQRQAAEAQIAAHRATQQGEHTVVFAEPTPADESDIVEPLPAPSTFQFNFTAKELFGSLAAAAVLFGLLHLLAGSSLPIILGAVALLGLIAQVIGMQPPPLVTLGWWLLLVLYLLMGFWTAVS